MTPDTLFHMGSVSKAFYATALGLLMDDFAQGRDVTALPAGVKELTWHTRLKDVLPDRWAPMDTWATESVSAVAAKATQVYARLPEWFGEETATMIAGPGGVISNAIDMAKWVSTWINEGVYDGRAIIPAHVYRNVTYARSVVVGHPPVSERSIIGYVMGWVRYSYREHDVVWHNGGLPGHDTLVSFLPADEIGLTLFANGDQQMEPLTLISNRILELALRLERSLAPTSPPSPNVPDPEVQTGTFSRSLDVFSGTYSNPGYGSFTLCSPSSASSYCPQVQSDFAIVDDAQCGGGPTAVHAREGEVLLAAWSRVWTSHVRMRRKQGLVFDVFFTSLFPNGYGRDTTLFETTEGVAEFVVEGDVVVGFGVSGMVGMVTERERTYEDVRERADVWFDKVLV